MPASFENAPAHDEGNVLELRAFRFVNVRDG